MQNNQNVPHETIESRNLCPAVIIAEQSYPQSWEL